MRLSFLTSILVLASFMASITCQAQVTAASNITWGHPTMQELQMTDYKPEPDAEAVVLYKTTDMKYIISENNEFQVQYDVKARIKILKPEGTKHAIAVINYTINDDKTGNREAVKHFSGTTYNLVNGSIEKTQLNSNMTSTIVPADARKRIMNIIFPNVKEGSVIEYEYTIISDLYLEIKDWEAQCEIPVAYTRYEFSIPEWFDFYMQILGAEYNTSRVTHKQMPNRPTFTIMTSAQSFSCLGNNFEFEGRNLSPIKTEDLVFNPLNTGQRVVVDITGMSLPNRGNKNFAMTWEEIDNHLLSRNDFGKLIKNNPLKKEMKQAGIMQLNSDDEKIQATINLLRQRVKWNGSYSLYGTPPKNVVKNGSGNNSELNFLLIAMLNDAGIKAYPAILATRDRDYTDIETPNLKRMSTTVAVINNGGKYQVFDGSATNASIDVLPSSFLVKNARIVGKDITNPWINLEDKGIAKSNYKLTGALAQDGTLSATCVITHQGKAAELMRATVKSSGNNSLCQNKKFQSPSFHITDYRVDGIDNTELPVTETIKFSYNATTDAGMIKLQQLLWPLIDNSRFESEKRYNPIEFPYKVDETATIAITIPEGWTVTDSPAPMSLNTSDNNITMSITPSAAGNVLNISTQLSINRLNYTKRDYNSIRNLANRITMHCKEPFTIKKQ